MITYALALKLKNLGFPQGGNIFTSRLCPHGSPESGGHKCEYESVKDPNLSELIKACGEHLSHIKRLPNGVWFAVSHCGCSRHQIDGNNLEEVGSTPEEAVANLWLALNKK